MRTIIYSLKIDNLLFRARFVNKEYLQIKFQCGTMSTKRKRVSKKNKISWRKNIDITDVDDFLEEKRLEERLGKPFTQKEDNELFEIDTKGGGYSVSIAHNVTGSLVKPTLRKSLRIAENETPKSFEILERRSAVPDPVKKRNKINPKKYQISKPSIKNPKHPEPLKKTLNSNSNLRDIWSEKKELPFNAEWLTNDTVRHTLSNIGAGRKVVPKSVRQKPSALPAIEPPHPGGSYNPSLKDHRELIEEVALEEFQLEKKEKHIKRVTTHMFEKVPAEQVEKAWLTEMSVGLEPTVLSEDSGCENPEYSAVNPPVERKKKTLKERRKQREHRARLMKVRMDKIEKKKRSDVHNKLPVFQKELDRNLEESRKKQEKRKVKKDGKIFETKLLAKTRFEAPLKEFTAPQDLKGNLRNVLPVGNILSDRFVSLKKRNILEPTIRRPVRKGKKKKFIKPSHRMDFDPKGY